MAFPSGEWAAYDASRRARLAAYNRDHGTSYQLGRHAEAAAIAQGLRQDVESSFLDAFEDAWDDGRAESASLSQVGQSAAQQLAFERAGAAALAAGDPPGVAVELARLLASSVRPGDWPWSSSRAAEPGAARVEARRRYARSLGLSKSDAAALAVSKSTTKGPAFMTPSSVSIAGSAVLGGRHSWAPYIPGLTRPARVGAPDGAGFVAAQPRDVTVSGKAETGMMLGLAAVAALGVYYVARRRR